jgi:hypothetical protein
MTAGEKACMTRKCRGPLAPSQRRTVFLHQHSDLQAQFLDASRRAFKAANSQGPCLCRRWES